MDGQAMNATKNVVNNIRNTRTDLKANTDDRKTKVFAQTFVNNLGALCHQAKNQHEILKNLDSGTGKGETGEEGMKINKYEILSDKMKNELSAIIKCCSKVLTLPKKGQPGGMIVNEEMSAKHWENVNMQVKSLGTKVIN